MATSQVSKDGNNVKMSSSNGHWLSEEKDTSNVGQRNNWKNNISRATAYAKGHFVTKELVKARYVD